MKPMTKIIPALLLLTLTACQDHHFVTMEKAEKIKFPTLQGNGKSFNDDGTAKKYVMTDEYRQKGEKKRAEPTPQLKGSGRLIAEGRLTLGAKIADKNFSGYTVYIIAWNNNQTGPPTAVIKESGDSFPISFTLTEKDLMAGGFPSEGDPLSIEARLDSDGDVMSKVAGDYYGVTSKPLTTGAKGIELVIDKAR